MLMKGKPRETGMLAYTNKYWKQIIPPVKKPLARRYGKAYAKELIAAAEPVYRELLSRADDVGAKNPMAGNLYQALIFFALRQAADGKMTEDDLRGITDELLSTPPFKAFGLFINLNKPLGIKLMAAGMRRSADWIEEHPQYKDVSWDFNFDETKHKQGFYYHFTRCPIYAFAQREGFLGILPIICDTDFKTAENLHGRLIREQTLARGGTVCDYWYVGSKEQDPR